MWMIDTTECVTERERERERESLSVHVEGHLGLNEQSGFHTAAWESGDSP